jgi:hypothetical protein
MKTPTGKEKLIRTKQRLLEKWAAKQANKRFKIRTVSTFVRTWLH